MPRSSPTSGTPEGGNEGLWSVYAQAVEEYRFQVEQTWDRIKFFLLAVAATVGAATGLLQLGGTVTTDILVVVLFIAGAVLAWLGQVAIGTSKTYKRETHDHLRALEQRLGIAKNVAMSEVLRSPATTEVSGKQVSTTKREPRGRWAIRPGSVVGVALFSLKCMFVGNVLGAGLVVHKLVGCVLWPRACEEVAPTIHIVWPLP